ncbi:MAG: hypothetical protein MUF24_00670 [Chitinophagaceae bacterium]|nr:hypothetical protein [Chitinophagaceae bacterium]
MMIALCCSLIANLWPDEKASKEECAAEPPAIGTVQQQNLPPHDVRYSPLDVGLW